VHNNVLLCLDEIGQANAEDVWNAGYMLANSQGKGRGTITGGVRELASWQLIFLSSGEVAFEDHAKSKTGQGAKAGQKARIISISADAGSNMGIFSTLPPEMNNPGDFAKLLAGKTKTFYGTAAEAFVEGIIGDLESAKNKVKKTQSDFVAKVCPTDADGQVSRVAANFGLVAAAGEIATQRKILPWSHGRAFEATRVAFNLWLKHRGGMKSDEIIQGCRQVRRFIEKHGEDRFTVIAMVGNSWKSQSDDTEFDTFSGRTRDRVGYRFLDGDERWVYLIFAEAWGTDLCEGFDSKLIASELAAQGYLRRSGNRNSVSRNLPGSGKVRVYELSSSILSDESG